jgi:hypothetical protein
VIVSNIAKDFGIKPRIEVDASYQVGACRERHPAG